MNGGMWEGGPQHWTHAHTDVSVYCSSYFITFMRAGYFITFTRAGYFITFTRAGYFTTKAWTEKTTQARPNLTKSTCV